jgi:DDE_Tnp_1-associated
MSLTILLPPEKSRLRALLDHFSVIEDPREPWRVAHPVAEVLLLVVCGMIADCDDYEGIAEWGKAHFLLCRAPQPRDEIPPSHPSCLQPLQQQPLSRPRMHGNGLCRGLPLVW